MTGQVDVAARQEAPGGPSGPRRCGAGSPPTCATLLAAKGPVGTVGRGVVAFSSR